MLVNVWVLVGSNILRILVIKLFIANMFARICVSLAISVLAPSRAVKCATTVDVVQAVRSLVHHAQRSVRGLASITHAQYPAVL